MITTANITKEKDRLIVSGDLDFFTVMSIWQQSLLLFPSLKNFIIDLSKINSSNSAGLALIIEWIKYANNAKKNIHFIGTPAQFKLLISAAHLEKIFPEIKN